MHMLTGFGPVKPQHPQALALRQGLHGLRHPPHLGAAGLGVAHAQLQFIKTRRRTQGLQGGRRRKCVNQVLHPARGQADVTHHTHNGQRLRGHAPLGQGHEQRFAQARA